MKITIFLPKTVFTSVQVKRLEALGEVNFSSVLGAMSTVDCIALAKGSDILGLDPDNFGGFEKAEDPVTRVCETCPTLKGVTLATTSFGWVDRGYLAKRKIPLCNVPGYSRESVAEHTIALLLCMAKRILITDRRTQKGKYVKEMGFELAGKTLGIIGLGNIGTRTAELARGIGMEVIAYNHSPRKEKGVIMVPLEKLLKQSDAIAIHITHKDENICFIGRKELTQVKKGVIIVNTADEGVIDEAAMVEALKSGRVDMYTSEGTLFENTPMAGMERAIGLNGFGYYTKEAIANLWEIFINNIISLANDSPQNLIRS